MIKKQQMRWNRWTIQPFLDVRVAVLDGTLENSSRKLYPDFRQANNHAPVARATRTPHTFAWSRSTVDGRKCQLSEVASPRNHFLDKSISIAI